MHCGQHGGWMVQPQRSGDRGERWRKDQCHSLKFLSCIRLTFTSDSIHIKTQGTLAPTGCLCLSVSISRLGACKQSKITASAAVPRACPAHRHFAGQSNAAFSCSARWAVGVIARDLPARSRFQHPPFHRSSHPSICLRFHVWQTVHASCTHKPLMSTDFSTPTSLH